MAWTRIRLGIIAVMPATHVLPRKKQREDRAEAHDYCAQFLNQKVFWGALYCLDGAKTAWQGAKEN
jgi:hypothetical protein